MAITAYCKVEVWINMFTASRVAPRSRDSDEVSRSTLLTKSLLYEEMSLNF